MQFADILKKKDRSPSDDGNGLDILTEIKEPFSLSGFFETHVVERVKRIKGILADHGVLFFLFSPFMARGRLIAQIFILCVGILFGVIPRASSLVDALQEQAYASEIAGLEARTVGSLTIIPAASSNYKKLHMLAFVLKGEDLPSDASKYEVHLARGYGASDWEDVTYSWTTYPVTDRTRILLVAIDQSKQASGYGAFNLYIQLTGEEVSDYARTPFEVTLSTAQDTTDLYDRTGIHLSALTKAVCGMGKIAEKHAEFMSALDRYQVAVEQAEAMPVEMSVTPDRDMLESYCLVNRVYRALDDDSTTEDILGIEAVDGAPELDYGVVIKSGGISYDSGFVKQLREDAEKDSDEDLIRFQAFDSVDAAKESVLSAMENVNTEAIMWYNTLTSYKLILNQTIRADGFPLHARCTNSVTDGIDFFDGEAPGPADENHGGLSGTMTGDDPYVRPTPSGDDGQPAAKPTETPIATPQPTETPATTPQPTMAPTATPRPTETPEATGKPEEVIPDGSKPVEEKPVQTQAPYVPVATPAPPAGHTPDPADSK